MKLSTFLRGTRRLNPSIKGPTGTLSGLQRAPFEPLESVELKILSLKTVLASFKRVGDLQVFSASESCLEM